MGVWDYFFDKFILTGYTQAREIWSVAQHNVTGEVFVSGSFEPSLGFSSQFFHWFQNFILLIFFFFIFYSANRCYLATGVAGEEQNFDLCATDTNHFIVEELSLQIITGDDAGKCTILENFSVKCSHFFFSLRRRLSPHW